MISYACPNLDLRRGIHLPWNRQVKCDRSESVRKLHEFSLRQNRVYDKILYRIIMERMKVYITSTHGQWAEFPSHLSFFSASITSHIAVLTTFPVGSSIQVVNCSRLICSNLPGKREQDSLEKIIKRISKKKITKRKQRKNIHYRVYHSSCFFEAEFVCL